MRFRHFRRYYLEMEWDWPRLGFLLETLEAAHSKAVAEVRGFESFLLALGDAAGP
jgi:hypothetical protein